MDRLAAQGFSEVVITGVQLGAWGKDLPGRPSLSRLIGRAADRIAPGRLRLSSIEPWSVDAALIEVVQGHPRVCPHLHLPLQSGDDGILEAMRRGYTARQYLDTVDGLRKALPDIAIGTDVLLGFPGEDEAAFRNTQLTIEAMKPAYLHAFSYSPRPRTAAAKLPGKPPKAVVRDRNRRIRELGETFTRAFRESHDGGAREVIVEEQRAGVWRGLTDTFVKVVFETSVLSCGQLVRARLAVPDNGSHLIARKIDDA